MEKTYFILLAIGFLIGFLICWTFFVNSRSQAPGFPLATPPPMPIKHWTKLDPSTPGFQVGMVILLKRILYNLPWQDRDSAEGHHVKHLMVIIDQKLRKSIKSA